MPTRIFPLRKNNQIMADIKASGNTKVKTIKAQFKEAYGATLRVYTGMGKKYADDNETLASARHNNERPDGDGAVDLHGNMLVKTVEERFMSEIGVKVQVANADDSKLADNDAKLGSLA